MNNKTVLVTGATSGIGKAIVFELCKTGNYNVAVCGRNDEKMKFLIEKVAIPENSSAKFYAKTFDITIEKEVESFIDETVAKIGDIDILINCAGANTSRSSIETLKTEDFEYMLKLNAIAPFVFIKNVIPAMKAKKAGMIINILSTSCLFASENAGGYSASKSTLDSLSKVLRKELRPYHIKVCSIYPGGTDTPFRENERPDYLKPETVAQVAMNAITLPNEAAIDEIVVRPFVEKNFT